MINRSSKRSFETCSPILPCGLRFEGFLLSLLSFSFFLSFFFRRSRRIARNRRGRKRDAFEYLQFSSVLVYPNLGSRTAERCDLVYCFHRGQQLRISARWIPLWEWTVFAWIRYDTFGWTRSMYHNPAKSPIVVQPMVVFFFSFLSFFLSFFFIFLSRSPPSQPLPGIFLNSEFPTVSFRERTKSIIDRTGSWQIFRSSPISSSDLLEKREEQRRRRRLCL